MKTIMAVAVMLSAVAGARSQSVPMVTSPVTSGSHIEKAPELNHDALNAIPSNDISARVRVFQGAIDNSVAWMRRQRAQQKPQPNIETPAINPQEH